MFQTAHQALSLNGLLHFFFPYRGVEGNFLNLFLGLKKQEFQEVAPKITPKETNFPGMTPLENLATSYKELQSIILTADQSVIKLVKQ